MNNVFMLVGRLTRDGELRYTDSDRAVSNITLAVNNSKEDTSFIAITAFGQIAENLAKYCRKGDLIGVQGTIKNHNWTDKEGNNRYEYSFIAQKITFLSTNSEKIKEEAKQETSKNSNPFADFGEEVKIDDNFLE